MNGDRIPENKKTLVTYNRYKKCSQKEFKKLDKSSRLYVKGSIIDIQYIWALYFSMVYIRGLNTSGCVIGTEFSLG